jgi:nickel/cobalt exporter
VLRLADWLYCAMLEAAFYLASSFWLGALHAATPGHGKTVAAAYLVGARGRVVDAVVLGIFVTLAHTGGIVAFGILATLGSSALLPRQAEGYLSLATGLLVVCLGLWMLWSQRDRLPFGKRDAALAGAHSYSDHEHTHDDHGPPDRHEHEHGHGWGHTHSHSFEALAEQRPSLGLLLGLGIAGGIAPDPAALAVLLSAIANGKLVVGLLTVLVFSIGFASVLVVVGLIAARAGRLVLDRFGRGSWLAWVQLATSVLILGVGVVLTAGAWDTLTTLR